MFDLDPEAQSSDSDDSDLGERSRWVTTGNGDLGNAQGRVQVKT